MKIFEIVLKNGAYEITFKECLIDAWIYAIRKYGLPSVKEVNEIEVI